MSLGKYLRNPSRVAKKIAWHTIHAGPRRDITVATGNGLFTFDSADAIIGKRLYVDGGYELPLIGRTMELLLREGHLPSRGSGRMIDIGANIGMICVALLRQGYFNRAIAFEPGPANFRLLETNVAQNGLAHRILTVPCALSAADGEMQLELSAYNSGDHRIRHTSTAGAYGEDKRVTLTVPVHTLDSFFAHNCQLTADDVELVWMDIQGHEGQFLRGARNFLARGVPVVTEFWPYGILRSGMTRPEFQRTVGELFTHFYLPAGDLSRRPVELLDSLWDEFPGPKQVSEVILVRE
ncbi:MAG: FkbM family methyltransferase [Gemmatimonadaceae bacterium]